MTNKIDKIQMPDGQALELSGGFGLEVCDIGMTQLEYIQNDSDSLYIKTGIHKEV